MVRRRRQHGFTMIEGVVALVILSIAVPAMLWAVRLAHLGRIAPVMTSRARWLATEKMEDIIADRHSSTRGYAYLRNSNYGNEPSITGFPGFSRRVNFHERGPTLTGGGSGYMVVTVRVDWTDAAGVSRRLELDTVVTDYTP